MRAGEVIRVWRHINKLSSSEAAAKIGISVSALLRVEKGTMPDGQTIVKLFTWLTEPEAVNANGNSGQEPSDEVDAGKGE